MTAARPMRRKSLLYSHPAVLQVAKPLGICSSSSGAEHSTGTAEAASYRTKEATGVHSTGLRQVFLGEEVRSLLLTVETTVETMRDSGVKLTRHYRTQCLPGNPQRPA